MAKRKIGDYSPVGPSPEHKHHYSEIPDSEESDDAGDLFRSASPIYQTRQYNPSKNKVLAFEPSSDGGASEERDAQSDDSGESDAEHINQHEGHHHGTTHDLLSTLESNNAAPRRK